MPAFPPTREASLDDDRNRKMRNKRAETHSTRRFLDDRDEKIRIVITKVATEQFRPAFKTANRLDKTTHLLAIDVQLQAVFIADGVFAEKIMAQSY